MYNINAGYGREIALAAKLAQATTGKTFIVAATSNNNLAILQQIFKPDNDGVVRFFNSINAVVSSTTASQGDVILVAPGHTETVTAAGGITLSTAGVAVVGLGEGDNRPQITFSTVVGASILISGKGCSLKNIIGITAIDQITNPIDITADDVTIDMEWRDGSAILEAVSVVRAVTVKRLNLKLVHKGFTAGTHGINPVKLNAVTGARINIDFYGKAGTAVINFVTALSTDVQIVGTFYNSGTTDFSKNVVDTITGSIWGVQGFDAAAGTTFGGGSGQAVAASSNDNVPSADATANVLTRDAVGNKTDAAIYTPGTTKSIMAAAKGTIDVAEKVAASATAVIANAGTIFTIAGGPIQIIELVSLCITGNDGTASTIQYQANPTVGAATTISGASASVANALAGASVVLNATALSTAPDVNTVAASLGGVKTRPIIVPAGTIKTVVGVGSTTGTWTHFMRYIPLARSVTVV